LPVTHGLNANIVVWEGGYEPKPYRPHEPQMRNASGLFERKP
jgi:hypothetical protein